MEVVNLTEWLPDVEDQRRGAFAILVKNLLSPEECDALIGQAQKSGFCGELEQAASLRSGQRAMADDPVMAATLLGRLKEHLPPTWDPATCSRGPINTDLCQLQGAAGLELSLKGLNERFRFLKYTQGQYFNGHIDGYFVRNPESELYMYTDRGVLTVQIYLNAGKGQYQGGSTRFLHPDCPHSKVLGFCGGERCDKGLCKHRDDVSQGDAIIFQHDLLHQGSILLDGMKLTCRTEVMYGTQPEDIPQPENQQFDFTKS